MDQNIHWDPLLLIQYILLCLQPIFVSLIDNAMQFRFVHGCRQPPQCLHIADAMSNAEKFVNFNSQEHDIYLSATELLNI